MDRSTIFLSNNAHHLYSLVVFKVIQLREKVHVRFGQQKLIVVVGYKLLLQLLYLRLANLISCIYQHSTFIQSTILTNCKKKICRSKLSLCKNLLSASTQIPLHNICLIMLISQNGLIITEKKKVNNYVVCRPFGNDHILSKWSPIVEWERVWDT